MSAEPDIALDYLGLIVARTRKAEEMLADYDRDVHRPAMDALRKRCAETGHKPADRWHSNGPGWLSRHCGDCGSLTRYCGACGSRIELVGPEGGL